MNVEDFKVEFMKEAMIEARKAYSIKETPIGAVVVHENKIIGRGYNQIEIASNPTLHAEVVAIKQAAENLGRWRLNDCELYVTMEPCFMCAGAIVNSRIKKVYVGAKHSKNHMVSKHNSFIQEFYKDYKVEYIDGILEYENSCILTKFFSERRKEKK
ncbi:nucleoside deaminase [Peptostreptococcus faecalis]|uniref:nucleoside deaminase n=1 Tax=Peptostreptococcus faecalis TaxID=2045015 RepID=UPI000C7B88AF|nr:nucleoside deaminase [Peptostreptococcus faecalis]